MPSSPWPRSRRARTRYPCRCASRGWTPTAPTASSSRCRSARTPSTSARGVAWLDAAPVLPGRVLTELGLPMPLLNPEQALLDHPHRMTTGGTVPDTTLIVGDGRPAAARPLRHRRPRAVAERLVALPAVPDGRGCAGRGRGPRVRRRRLGLHRRAVELAHGRARRPRVHEHGVPVPGRPAASARREPGGRLPPPLQLGRRPGDPAPRRRRQRGRGLAERPAAREHRAAAGSCTSSTRRTRSSRGRTCWCCASRSGPRRATSRTRTCGGCPGSSAT